MSGIDLSVVATSRNDDHGGNLVERTQYFIEGLADVATRQELSTELVLVEWNPPSDRPPLVETIVPPASSNLSIRVVTVPAEVHQGLRHASALPMFQMIAKNVGIRRCAGRMVLATNVDVVMTLPLADAIRDCRAPRTVYRCDRADVVFDVAASPSVDLDALRTTPPLRINRSDGVHYPGHGRVVPSYRSFADLVRYRAGALVDRRRKPHGGRLVPAGTDVHGARLGLASRVRDRWSALQGVRRLPRIHLPACGDFTLIDRGGWAELRGYPEWEVHSWNLDSLLLFQAHAVGFDFVDLREGAELLHIEQSAGSAWTPEHGRKLYERLVAQGVPVLADGDLRDLALALERGRPRLPQFNGSDWGFGSRDLPEVTI